MGSPLPHPHVPVHKPRWAHGPEGRVTRLFCAHHESYGTHSTGECTTPGDASMGLAQYFVNKAMMASGTARTMERDYYTALRDYKEGCRTWWAGEGKDVAHFNAARVVYVGYLAAEDDARHAHRAACAALRRYHLLMDPEHRPVDPMEGQGRVTATSADGQRGVALPAYIGQPYPTFLLPEGAIETDQVEMLVSPDGSPSGSSTST